MEGNSVPQKTPLVNISLTSANQEKTIYPNAVEQTYTRR